MNYAATKSDPVERFKAFLTSNIAFLRTGRTFRKPLNPVLGETFEARGADGTKIYVEQTSHHPMVSHYLMEGPLNLWSLSSWFRCTVHTGMTSFKVNYEGGKVLRFHDGQTITATIPTDSFNNLPMGTIYYQIHDKIEFVDEKNGLYALVNVGNVKKKSQEYFEGEILHHGQKLCDISGNYCGYLDFIDP